MVTAVEQQSGNDVSLDASTGEVTGYRVYRIRAWDGATIHVADTEQTFVFDAPSALGPWTYQVFPLDLNGRENLESVEEAIPVPEPAMVSALATGCILLAGLARRRDREDLRERGRELGLRGRSTPRLRI